MQKFYGEPFVDPPESEIGGGHDNHIVQSQPLRSRDNVYEYKDSPAKLPRSQMDLNVARSPSALTQTTKVGGSQSSIKSMISLKESPSFPAAKDVKKSEKEIENKFDSNRSDVTEKSSIFSSNTASSMDDYFRKSPVSRPRTNKSSHTVLDAGGIPQTEV